MKPILPFKRLLILATLLTAIGSCKKDAPANEDPQRGVPSAYWISTNTNDQFSIFKGSTDPDGTRTVSTVYSRNADRYVWYMRLRPGTRELYWCEVQIHPDDAVTSYIYKGDTLGNAPTLVLTRPNLMGNIAIHPITGEVYWSQYEEADQHEYLYRSKNDGTVITKLFPGRDQLTMCDMQIDVKNNLLYFIEGYNEGSITNDYKVCKGNLDGSGLPEVLYDLQDMPAPTLNDDRLSGLAVHGTDLYLSLRAFHTGQMNYIVKGNTTGTAPLTILVKSLPSNNYNPLETPLGITLDKDAHYLYWTNQTPTNNTALGSIYRIRLTASSTPEKILGDISVTGGLYGPLELGE